MGYLRFFVQHPSFLCYGLLLTLASNCGQTYFISFFSEELRATLDLNPLRYGSIYSVATLTSAGLLPWIGRFIDHVDLRLYTLFVFAGLVVGCFAIAETTSVPALFLAFLALRLFGQGLLGHTAGTSMARYFDFDRGKAMAFVALGFALGEGFLPRAIVALKGRYGWQQTWYGTGGALLLVFVPTVWWLLRGHGERHRALVERLANENRSESDGAWRRRHVLRDRRFYLLLAAVLTPPFIGTGVFFHQDTLRAAKGWSEATFADAFFVYAAATVVTSLFTGRLVDRFRARRLVIGYLLPQGLALLVLSLYDQPAIAFAYMLGAGMTAGASSPIVGALWAELYGVKHLGAIRSLVHGAMVFSTAGAPVTLGWLIESQVSVSMLALAGCALTVVCSLGAAVALRPPLVTRYNRVARGGSHEADDAK